MSVGVNAILNLSAGDYVEVIAIQSLSGDPKIDTDSSTLPKGIFYIAD